MKHQQCTLSDLEINMQDVYLALGYKNVTPDEDILSMINQIYAEVNTICKPQYIYEIYPSFKCDKVSITVNDVKLRTGKIIADYLDGMEKCCVFATTAGIEYDTCKKQFRQRGDIPEEFIADAIGSAIAEACVNKIEKELAEETAGYVCTYPYSPGYCAWKLVEQRLLFSLLSDTPCGITLTESCLMMPIKSTTGIIGIGKDITRKAYSCSICGYKNCYKRKEM